MSEQPQAHQTMPHSPDVEEAVIACLFHMPTENVMDVPVRSSSFYLDRHRAIFEAMMSVVNDGQAIDVIGLTEKMRNDGTLDTLGVLGTSEMMRIYGSFLSFANIIQYCEMLETMYKRRELIVAATKAIQGARELDSVIEDVIAVAQSRISVVTEERDNECLTLKALGDLETQVRDRELGKSSSGLMTGVPAWDASLRGIFPGDMQLIGARPKVGKTAAIETAMQTQIELGIPVLCFQRDTSLTTMLGRMACRRARVIYEDFIFGSVPAQGLKRVRKAMQELRKTAPLLRLYNPARLTAADLHSIVIREIRKSKIRVWYLDHFQTLQYERKMITEGLTEASMSLRRTINDTGIPGVIIAQVSKDADKTGRPHSGQFKWCDQLFSDADKIVMMWSEVDPKSLSQHQRQMIQWTVDVSRTGAPSDNQMKFHREYLTFESETMPG